MSNCEGHLTRTAHLAVGIGIVALVTLSLAQAAISDSVKFTGVNISGAEFAPGKIPGEYNRDYTFPDPITINYYSEKGMNIIRLPVLWERLQNRLEEPLSESEMQRIDSVVDYATSKAMKIIIDVHNYAAYFGKSIGTRETPRHALGNLWRQIALRYKENDSVIFGLMNEPTGLPTETWLDAANIAIAEIRQVGEI
jgi:endoglucanase